jgi:hypothetical protein
MKVTDERIEDVISSYHGTIKAMAQELKEYRQKAQPSSNAQST